MGVLWAAFELTTHSSGPWAAPARGKAIVAGRTTRPLCGAPNVLAAYFANTAYVLVKCNQFRVRHLESNAEATFDAQPSFTTTRALIGEFRVAESLLKRALRQVTNRGFFSVAPYVVIQPLEMIEGGLSEVEERVLREVAVGAGASKVVVWVGPPLSDAEVKAKLHG